MTKFAKQNYEQVEGRLDDYLQGKTTHSTKDLLNVLRAFCNPEEVLFFQWQTSEEQQEFAQKCHNFELYSKQQGKTSWGRKQFEDWWNEGYDSAVHNATFMNDIVADPLPGFGEDPFLPVPEEERFDDLETANQYIRAQSQENRRLEVQVAKLQKKLDSIQDILNR